MATIAAAGIGAVGAIGGALLSGGGGAPGMSRSEKKAMAYGQLQQQAAAEQARLEGEVYKDILVRSEQGRLGLWSKLGDVGTYEQGYEDFRGGVGADYDPGNVHGVFTKIKKSGGVDTGALTYGKDVGKDFEHIEATGYGLAPGKFIDHVSKSRQFRMASYMTAQADQLVRQEGPLWQELKASVSNPIMQGSAAMNKQMLEQLSREAARGGSARNRAVQAANRIQGQAQIMRDRANALWQSNLALIQFSQDNARRQLSFNQAWSGNIAGVRDQFLAFSRDAQAMYGQAAGPMAMAAGASAMEGAQVSAQYRQAAVAADQENKQFLGSAIASAAQIIGGGVKGWASQGSPGPSIGQPGGFSQISNANNTSLAGMGSRVPTGLLSPVAPGY